GNVRRQKMRERRAAADLSLSQPKSESMPPSSLGPDGGGYRLASKMWKRSAADRWAVVAAGGVGIGKTVIFSSREWLFPCSVECRECRAWTASREA
ncbi:hypothetical protein THAOC_12043, partial [Thalassiosira oceanica]